MTDERKGEWLGGTSGVRLAWGLWALFVVVITVLVVLQPQRRTVTPNYVVGTRNWWARLDLYGPSAHGFLYPPQFAILYTPFARAPAPWGDVAWRWLNLGLFAWALVRLARLAGAAPERSAFPLLTLLSIPASLSSARNGQVNMTEAALLIHAAVDLAGARWWRATFSLALGTFLKPIALVMAVLAAALRLPMLWRLAVAALAGASLPFALASREYVLRQYRGLVEKMTVASAPGEDAFCDIGGLLNNLGLEVPDRALLLVRLAAAPPTLALAAVATRRMREPDRSLVLLAAAAIYIMVFNPRTETNGYVILAPVIAGFAARVWRSSGHRTAFRGLVVLALGLGADNYPFHHQTDLWLKPAIALVFLGYVVRLVARAPAEREAP